MIIIAGLGNPGRKYEKTRHNCGFEALDILADRWRIPVTQEKFRALCGTGNIDGTAVLLMKPQTFMNLSGEAVSEAARFYKIPPEHVLVVSDEISLPLGKLRVRPKGSAGGHNGLKSIIASLGSDAFPRIRIGVGAPPHPDYDMADWVLSVFRNQDLEDMLAASDRAAEAVTTYISNGPERAMNRFN